MHADQRFSEFLEKSRDVASCPEGVSNNGEGKTHEQIDMDGAIDSSFHPSQWATPRSNQNRLNTSRSQEGGGAATARDKLVNKDSIKQLKRNMYVNDPAHLQLIQEEEAR